MVAWDDNYLAPIHGADFAPDGRLATTSDDGRVHLYAPGLAGALLAVATVEPLVEKLLPNGKPYRTAFSPADGARLAVGYLGLETVSVLDGHTLAALPGPGFSGFGANLPAVAWSRDG